MDFFEHQAQAKAASQRLLFLFLLLTIAVVLAVDGVLYFILHFYQNTDQVKPVLSFENFIHWQFRWAGLAAASLSLGILTIGCFMRWLELRKGGGGLAVQIGARSLGFASKEDKEQQLLNVVAEMAIAAGINAPCVYVLDHESSINAFVVGYELDDTVLVVTRGLLNNMNRDELQAVVGHEFSHILHGDNRVNIHLMIMIAGFSWVGEIGDALSSRHRYGGVGYGRVGYGRGYGYSRRTSQQQQMWALGIPLIVIGFIGTLCGRLIRGAVSRKREYLADASSVQFTRNPDALASALNVIRTHSRQGLLNNARAEELSHLCISPSKSSTWFASHPPLEKRINAIDHAFIKRHEARQRQQKNNEAKVQKAKENNQTLRNMYSPDVAIMQQAGTSHMHDVIGTVTQENLEYAMGLHEQFPSEYKRALHSADNAKTMLLYLLLSQNSVLRAKQMGWLEKQAGIAQDYLYSLNMLSQGLQSRLALPLVELLMPMIKTSSEQEQKTLLKQALKLAKWDGKLSLFEICLYSLLKHCLGNAKLAGSYSIKDLNLVAHELNLVVSALIHQAGGTDAKKAGLHLRMMGIFCLKQKQTLLAEEAVSEQAFYVTLNKLKALSPMLKRSLMDVCGDIVFDDGIVQSGEYESLRLMSLLLACPLPPIFHRQR